MSPINVEDPWEGFNRGAYRFNTEFDRWVFLPVVRGYEFVVPDPAEQAVSNFFNNLGEIRNAVNSALQLRGDAFGTAFARFFINTTVGIGGLIDLATPFGYPEQREDFGQTLGRWGVAGGPYLVLPILGPSNLRDAGGIAVDIGYTSATPGLDLPQEQFPSPAVYYGLYGVDARHQNGFRYFQSGSPFEYEFVRFFYTKKRELEILK